MRDKIVTKFGEILSQINTSNGYNTDFDRFFYWASTPTEYDYNYLIYRDTTEEYSFHNTCYKAKLNLEIIAIVIETDNTAALLGNLALDDLIKACRQMETCGFFVNLHRSHKYVETRGKTACQIELETQITHRI